ncbi:CHAT domain-containing protein [Dactylosporangium matsuzakiense]|uniref:CHAT domain-containing protein n=1 Tax=Dactylosporangium matsuzakiense TaxID=53360 RepID=A0A9W6KS11_9ACTN|nr:CHAT domain-containing protein [Dactylosporangium matsuzakiense]UWZ44583.1 CHAT domain-containing protein [Dactylosporangium matsuzakiense]GLL05345.1 hypothetical protein GCM10017581_070920 [Dactylosporangium matsuzakiense]
MAATGVVLDASGFEVLAKGARVGPRRVLGAADVSLLEDVTARYVGAVATRSGTRTFLGLGRELYSWLDGDGRAMRTVTGRLGPVEFEVRASGAPSSAGWAVLRAPWELLAEPDGGFLTGDALLRFSVARRVGQPATGAGPDGFRLGLAFMASSPWGRNDLDYEAEEAAIRLAVGADRVDLLVEDTGDPVELGRRLADVRGMPVVHLSCHGHNAWRQPDGKRAPVLMLEDEQGSARPTTAADLLSRLRNTPRLVFVSACLTATGNEVARRTSGLGGGRTRDFLTEPVSAVEPMPDSGGGLVAHSLATALVAAGVPSVLGWDGSVQDRAATVFAAHLYGALAEQAPLAEAVGDARRALLTHDVEGVRADWHLARLWLGPTGGGPVAGGTLKRSLTPADRGTRALLTDKPHPAASPVNRRPELQQALRALRGGNGAGVLLHGPAGSGKSVLAARIIDRFPDHAVGVVLGDYTALAVFDAVARAVQTLPEARTLLDRALADVRDERPHALERVLIDVLTGPCAQAGAGRRPLLLVIDELDQVLEGQAENGHRFRPDVVPALAAVLRSFAAGGTDSRLLITSQYPFALDGLQHHLHEVRLEPRRRDLSGTDIRARDAEQESQTLNEPAERHDESKEPADPPAEKSSPPATFTASTSGDGSHIYQSAASMHITQERRKR